MWFKSKDVVPKNTTQKDDVAVLATKKKPRRVRFSLGRKAIALPRKMWWWPFKIQKLKRTGVKNNQTSLSGELLGSSVLDDDLGAMKEQLLSDDVPQMRHVVLSVFWVLVVAVLIIIVLIYVILPSFKSPNVPENQHVESVTVDVERVADVVEPTVAESPSLEPSTEPKPTLLRVNSGEIGFLNVRSGPATTFEIVTRINHDEEYSYDDNERDDEGIVQWYHLTATQEDSSDETELGWVSAEYVELLTSEEGNIEGDFAGYDDVYAPTNQELQAKEEALDKRFEEAVELELQKRLKEAADE